MQFCLFVILLNKIVYDGTRLKLFPGKHSPVGNLDNCRPITCDVLPRL